MNLREALDRRQDYMNNKITHQDYYETIGICFGIVEHDLPCSMEKVNEALNNGDIHLNTIPLSLWDRKHYVVSSLKRCRFWWSLSDSVCVLKAMAKYFAK